MTWPEAIVCSVVSVCVTYLIVVIIEECRR